MAVSPGQTTIGGDVWFERDTLRADAAERVKLAVANVGGTFHVLTPTDIVVVVDVPAGMTAALTVTDRPSPDRTTEAGG